MSGFPTSNDSCAHHAVAITKADADLSAPVRALYVGTGGNVKVTTVDGDAVTFANVSGGTILPVSVTKVWSTGTTASDFVGLV